MYQYAYTIYLFYSDEEPADEDDDDDDDDPDWQGDGDLGEGSGETGRPPTKRLRADSLGGTSGNRGRGGRARGGRARGGRARGGGTANTSSKSYNDADTKNDLPPFQPNRPPGVHFGRQVLRGGMTTALEFFRLFFTSEMINQLLPIPTATHT